MSFFNIDLQALVHRTTTPRDDQCRSCKQEQCGHPEEAVEGFAIGTRDSQAVRGVDGRVVRRVYHHGRVARGVVRRRHDDRAAVQRARVDCLPRAIPGGDLVVVGRVRIAQGHGDGSIGQAFRNVTHVALTSSGDVLVAVLVGEHPLSARNLVGCRPVLRPHHAGESLELGGTGHGLGFVDVAVERSGIHRLPRATPVGDLVVVGRVTVDEFDRDVTVDEVLGDSSRVALTVLGDVALFVLVDEDPHATRHHVGLRPVLRPFRAGEGFELGGTGHGLGFVDVAVERLRVDGRPRVALGSHDVVTRRVVVGQCERDGHGSVGQASGNTTAVRHSVRRLVRCTVLVGERPDAVRDTVELRPVLRPFRAGEGLELTSTGHDLGFVDGRVAPVTRCRAPGRVGTLAGECCVQEGGLERIVGAVERLRHCQRVESAIADELGRDVVLTALVQRGCAVGEGADGVHQDVVVADERLGPRGVSRRRTVVRVRDGANCQRVAQLEVSIRTRCRRGRHRSGTDTIEGVGPGRVLDALGLSRGIGTADDAALPVVVGAVHLCPLDFVVLPVLPVGVGGDLVGHRLAARGVVGVVEVEGLHLTRDEVLDADVDILVVGPCRDVVRVGDRQAVARGCGVLPVPVERLLSACLGRGCDLLGGLCGLLGSRLLGSGLLLCGLLDRGFLRDGLGLDVLDRRGIRGRFGGVSRVSFDGLGCGRDFLLDGSGLDLHRCGGFVCDGGIGGHGHRC